MRTLMLMGVAAVVGDFQESSVGPFRLSISSMLAHFLQHQ